MQNKPPMRDPQTQAAHRRETWLQIILPLLIGALAGGAAFGVTAAAVR